MVEGRGLVEGKVLLGEDITREEVVWALCKLKVKATAGRDGITAEMMNREVLVELWWELFSKANYEDAWREQG